LMLNSSIYTIDGENKYSLELNVPWTFFKFCIICVLSRDIKFTETSFDRPPV
jgi:hypothetical protein